MKHNTPQVDFFIKYCHRWCAYAFGEKKKGATASAGWISAKKRLPEDGAKDKAKPIEFIFNEKYLPLVEVERDENGAGYFVLIHPSLAFSGEDKTREDEIREVKAQDIARSLKAHLSDVTGIMADGNDVFHLSARLFEKFTLSVMNDLGVEYAMPDSKQEFKNEDASPAGAEKTPEEVSQEFFRLIMKTYASKCKMGKDPIHDVHYDKGKNRHIISLNPEIPDPKSGSVVEGDRLFISMLETEGFKIEDDWTVSCTTRQLRHLINLVSLPKARMDAVHQVVHPSLGEAVTHNR